MTITREMMASLKRSNVSKDAEKTKERVKADFSAAKNKNKTAIDALSGLKRTSIYRVFREGAVSAKIVLAMAQVLNVSPFYYTGAVDGKGECTDAVLHAFLVANGIRELAYQIAPGKNRAKAEPETQAAEDPAPAKPSKTAVVSAAGNPLFSSNFSNSPELAQAAADLTLDEAQQLLTALFIRAKAGGNAAQAVDLVKRCLLV
jgi:hypothetical protein